MQKKIKKYRKKQLTNKTGRGILAKLSQERESKKYKNKQKKKEIEKMKKVVDKVKAVW